MDMCIDCQKAHKEGKWYMSDEVSVPIDDCQVHPVIGNWRVTRTLRSLKYWSLCGEAYSHPHAKGLRLCLSFQRVHRHTAEAILFDYEKPFIDLLIAEGIIVQEESFDGVAKALLVKQEAAEKFFTQHLTKEEYDFFKKELEELLLKSKGKAAYCVKN